MNLELNLWCFYKFKYTQIINGGYNGKTGVIQTEGAFVEQNIPAVFNDLKGFECKSCPDV